MTATTAIPPLDLSLPALRDDPYPVFRWYREHAPVYRLDPPQPGGTVRYMLTRFADVAAGLRDLRLQRGVHAGAIWNRPLDSVHPDHRTFARVLRVWPLFRDPPEHTPRRRTINRTIENAFTLSLHESVAAAVDRVVGRLPRGGTFDAIADFAAAVPPEVHREMFGLHDRDPDEIANHLLAIAVAMGSVYDHDRLAAGSLAMETLGGWMRDGIAKCRTTGTSGGPLLDRLIEVIDRDRLVPQEEDIPLAILLMLAGQDTSMGLLGNGLHALLNHPDQLDLLRRNPDLIDAAVSEVLRYESPVQQMTRHAAESLEIRGVPIRAGDGVSFLLGAANRDPEVFPDPDRFDIARPDNGTTAAFGFGIHQCPGATMGRRVARTAWLALLDRFPVLTPAATTIRWRPPAAFRGPESLPVHTGH